MKRAICLLGSEFGYDREEVEVEVLTTGTNGMSMVRLPPGYSPVNLVDPWVVLESDGSIVHPVCQDFLKELA